MLPLVQHSHFAKFLLPLKWQACSHWRRVPCSEDQWCLTSLNNHSRRIQAGSEWIFRRESQPAKARSCWLLQEAWREGAGGSAGAGSRRNQIQSICQDYHFKHWNVGRYATRTWLQEHLQYPGLLSHLQCSLTGLIKLIPIKQWGFEKFCHSLRRCYTTTSPPLSSLATQSPVPEKASIWKKSHEQNSRKNRVAPGSLTSS